MENNEKEYHIRSDRTIVYRDQFTEDDIRDIEELREYMESDESRADWESEADVARGEGFWVDEDGHWRELPEDWDLW